LEACILNRFSGALSLADCAGLFYLSEQRELGSLFHGYEFTPWPSVFAAVHYTDKAFPGFLRIRCDEAKATMVRETTGQQLKASLAGEAWIRLREEGWVA